MKKNIIIFFIFCSYFQLCFAEGTASIKTTTLRVKLIDKDLSLQEVPVIKVLISYYPLGGIEFSRSKDLSYEQEAKKEGNIFNISSLSDVFYMYIYYEGGNNTGGLYYWIDNIYIIKSGSDLTILLDKQDVRFLGKGAAIPKIQSEIIKHSYETSKSDLKLINSKEYFRYFQKLDKSLDSALKLQLKVIERNKIVLGEYYVKVLTANCYGYRYFSQLRGYDMELMQNELFFKKFKEYSNKKRNVVMMPKFTDEVLDASPIFANYLIEELNNLERIGHEEYGPMLPDSCIGNILQKINNNYNGSLRDKLLTIFALRTSKNENAKLFFNEILDGVKTKRYNELLVKKIKVKQNNIPFKDFNLEDETGKRYTLDSFKNKVVVLDFWFTGCENCTILNEAMEPIINYFSSNPKIQFVSISIDKSKEQWLKSVQKGNYTHHGGINLYTNGEGANHDLIKHYNITSYPTVFVIRDGLMFSSLPPRPSRFIPSGQRFSKDGERFVDLLENAVK